MQQEKRVDNRQGMAHPPTFVTITFSHYCERVRWALDRSNVEYEEVSPCPGFAEKYWRDVLPGHGSSVPVLLFKDDLGAWSHGLGGSNHILDWLAQDDHGAWLYPNKESRYLSRYFDETLGRYSRAWFMNFFLYSEGAAERFVGPSDASAFFKFFSRVAWAPIRTKVAEINRSREWEEAQYRVDLAFEEVEQLLSDGRPYLAGDSFSAADLTFCSLSTPVVSPEYTRSYQPRIPSPAPLVAERLERWANSRAGEYIHQIYQMHRGDSPILHRMESRAA